MAQSAITVTPPNPTPPTNMGFTGTTAPNPPNYTKNTYNDPKNWGTGTPTSPPPFYDDGSAGGLTQITSAQPALASGSGATAGGTEGTYPGTAAGAVPASTSVESEGRGTEVVVTSPGSRAECPTQQVSVLGNRTTSPNGDHASSLSPTTNPALASISPTTAVSGASGTDTITFTGTNFTKQSVVWVLHAGIAGAVPRAVATTFVSATSLTAPVPKRTASGAGTVVWVVTGGVVETVTKPLSYT